MLLFDAIAQGNAERVNEGIEDNLKFLVLERTENQLTFYKWFKGFKFQFN
jgi:hypothetical protein